MALTPLVLLDTRIYYSYVDLTGYANKVDAPVTLDDEDATTFGSGGYKARVGGLKDFNGSATVLWQAGDTTQPDDILIANLGTNSQPLTLVPTLGTAGSVAYLTKVLESTYQTIAGDIGSLQTADATFMGNQSVARGQVMHPNGTARTTTGNTTGQQLGAVSAAQRMYSNLHVFSVTGTSPTLVVKLQSATTQGATYSDRITFSTASGTPTAQASSVVGAVTDTWWRVSYTIAGTSPSYMFAVSAGIAS